MSLPKTVKFTVNLFLAAGSHLAVSAIPSLPRTSPGALLTQDSDGGVTFLRGVSVELAEVSSFIRN